MNSVLFFVSGWCFFALFITSTSAGNLTCFTHKTNDHGEGALTNQTDCEYCGYHSWIGSCDIASQVERKCFVDGDDVQYLYTDSNGTTEIYNATDQCFSTQYKECTQYLRICDTDRCNLECIPSSTNQYSFASASMIALVFVIKSFFNM